MASHDTLRREVVIVGAGPTGLLLASELAEQGIGVMVLEATEAPTLMPKANGIVGHAAVELAKRGILRGTGLRVLTPPRFQFGPLPLHLGFGPGNPLHILPVPQRRLEELLERRGTQHGVEMRRGCEVVGFEQGDGRVEVGYRSATGASTVSASYLVGCDGARSAVRKHAGIGFPGFTSDEIARIARVTIPGDGVTARGGGFEIEGVGKVVAMRPNRMPGGGFLIAPAATLDSSAPADLYIISTQEPRGDLEPADALPVEELRSSLRRVLGAELPFTTATDVRSVVGNSRQADAYRRGKVLLAGDAAHIFNAGGSALNVALQDAIDLAARLTRVLRREAPEDELDTYERVRRGAGERALEQTRVQAALNRDDENASALRTVFRELVSTRSGARRLARMIESP